MSKTIGIIGIFCLLLSHNAIAQDETNRDTDQQIENIANFFYTQNAIYRDKKQYGFNHLMGIIGSIGFGMGDSDEVVKSFNFTAELGFSYLAQFTGVNAQGSGKPLVDIEMNLLFQYISYTSQQSKNSDNISLLTPELMLGLRIYLGSPVYLGMGIAFALNLDEDKATKEEDFPFVRIAPYASLGVFNKLDNFSLDVGIKWEYFPANSDLAQLYIHSNNLKHLRAVHNVNIVIGMYGII